MSWRSLIISQPAKLTLHYRSVEIAQQGQPIRVPLEDIAVIILEHAQISLTGQLLSACAEAKVMLITLGADHLPNGTLLPFCPHSRALNMMRAQLAIKRPQQKQLQQQLIRQKIHNQAGLLHYRGAERAASLLMNLGAGVRSGDPDNKEAQASQRYFRALFNRYFTRQQPRFYNAALNYTYAVVRACIARSLVCYGFLPAFGLFHDNALNAFNLADDLIEPFRALVDHHVLHAFQIEPERDLAPADKVQLVRILYQDVDLTSESSAQCTLLKAVDAVVISLQRYLLKQEKQLQLPIFAPRAPDIDAKGRL